MFLKYYVRRRSKLIGKVAERKPHQLTVVSVLINLCVRIILHQKLIRNIVAYLKVKECFFMRDLSP
jgi:hypothetical protein